MLKSIMSREPVMTIALVQAFLALAVSFGLPITVEQMGMLLAFTAAVLGWITRSHVSPTMK